MKTIGIISTITATAEARASYNSAIGEATTRRNGVNVYDVNYLKGTTASIAELHHYGTLTAKVVNNHDGGGWYIAKVYGESKSDADSVNTFLHYFDIGRRFTYRPVNGGFMEVE